MSGDRIHRDRAMPTEPGRGLEDRHYHPRLGWMNGQMRDFLTLLARIDDLRRRQNGGRG